MNSDEAVISLQGVSKSYGKRPALTDITLQIGQGVTGLLGPNGSGKSTMIKCLLGLLRFQRGTASVMGMPLPASAKAIRDRVGYVPEDDCFVAGLSGIESVRFLSHLSGLPGTEGLRRSHEVLDFADIGQERYRGVETYSTGMRQKLKFAQAIVHDPQLLILDEPTTGLDPQQRVALLSKIRNLAIQHDKSIVICTHILNDVKTVCDSVVIMAKGRVHLVDRLDNLTKPVRKGVQVWLAQSPGDSDDRRWEELLSASELAFEGGRDGSSYWIHDIDAHDTRCVWEIADRAGVHIRQLSAAKNSLEQVFFNAVKEAEDATA